MNIHFDGSEEHLVAPAEHSPELLITMTFDLLFFLLCTLSKATLKSIKMNSQAKLAFILKFDWMVNFVRGSCLQSLFGQAKCPVSFRLANRVNS